MNQIAGQAAGMIYGSGPYQDHHGGALWLQDSQGWFLVRNQAGIEWSAQFCADPAKVDLLRQNAQRLYNLVSPQVKQQLDPGGLLDTPIKDATGVAKWTDSIFNAGVPLHPNFHTGVLPGGGAQSPPAPGAARRARPRGEPPACRGAPLPHADRRHPAVQVRRFPAMGHRPAGQPRRGRTRGQARQRQRQRPRAVRDARLAACPAEARSGKRRCSADPRPGSPAGRAGVPEPAGTGFGRQFRRHSGFQRHTGFRRHTGSGGTRGT